jgi:hypothetical protein
MAGLSNYKFFISPRHNPVVIFTIMHVSFPVGHFQTNSRRRVTSQYYLRPAHNKALTKLAIEKRTIDLPSLLIITTTASKDDMCIIAAPILGRQDDADQSALIITTTASVDDMCIIAAPILGRQDDADQPTSRWRTVESDSCLSSIKHHSPRPSSPSSDSAPRMPHRTSNTQEGIRKTIKTVNGYENMDTERKFSKRMHSYIHHHLNQENSHGRESAQAARRLHSRWSSSAPIFVDRPPSYPRSCR